MKKEPDAGWTTEQWEQLETALRTPLLVRTVAQSRLIFYWREGQGFRSTQDVWNWRERGLPDS
jgi:hypothetical protein